MSKRARIRRLARLLARGKEPVVPSLPQAEHRGQQARFRLPDEGVIAASAAELASALKGEGVVVVHHWASWCAPCLDELEDLPGAHDTWVAAGASAVGVSWDAFQTPDATTARAQAGRTWHEQPFPSLVISGGADTLFACFPDMPQTIPQTWVVKGGKILWVHAAPLDDAAQAALLDALGAS